MKPPGRTRRRRRRSWSAITRAIAIGMMVRSPMAHHSGKPSRVKVSGQWAGRRRRRARGRAGGATTTGSRSTSIPVNEFAFYPAAGRPQPTRYARPGRPKQSSGSSGEYHPGVMTQVRALLGVLLASMLLCACSDGSSPGSGSGSGSGSSSTSGPDASTTGEASPGPKAGQVGSSAVLTGRWSASASWSATGAGSTTPSAVRTTTATPGPWLGIWTRLRMRPRRAPRPRSSPPSGPTWTGSTR